MDLGLNGKVALVAAASQGLGRAVAEELAIEGANLVLCARGEQRLNATCDEIRQRTRGDVIGVPADLAVSKDIEKLVETGLAKFKKIDILVTNVGGPPAGTFENFQRDAWEDATRSLLTSV